MLAAVLSFLGGSVFRMLWGEISNFIDKALEHKREMERLAQQDQFAANAHARMLESMTKHAELGIKEIAVRSEAELNRLDAETFLEGVKATVVQTGIAWVDAWNAVIRPFVASWAVAMLTCEGFKWIVLSEATSSVAYAALGLYLADRTLAKRGK